MSPERIVQRALAHCAHRLGRNDRARPFTRQRISAARLVNVVTPDRSPSKPYPWRRWSWKPVPGNRHHSWKGNPVRRVWTRPFKRQG